MKKIFKSTKSHLIKSLRNVIYILLLGVGLISCQKTNDGELPLIDSDAPSFLLTSTDGIDISLSQFNNKVLVLFFFGSNCTPCKEVAPVVDSILVSPYSSRSDYQVLGLDQSNGTSSAVESFRAETGLSIPLLLNAASVADVYKTTSDRLVIIDQSGKIVFSGTQNALADIASVKEKVKSLLEDQTGGTPVLKGNAPDFTLSSLSSGTVTLSDNKNKIVVLFFLGFNCPTCQAAAQDIESYLYLPYKERTDYNIFGLDIWDGNKEGLEAFKSIGGITFPLLMYASAISPKYKTTYDRLVIIDKKGDIVFSGNQSATSDLKAVKLRIDELLSNQ